MNETIRPKRGRKRYNEIRIRVRESIAARLIEEHNRHQLSVQLATYMVAVKEALDLPIGEEETALADYSIFEQESDLLTKAWIKQALKYMSAEFTPTALYKAWIRHSQYLYETPFDWFRVRWAIIEVAEGRADYGIISSQYYGFQNEEFFFDDSRITNPKGQNHTSWQLVKQEEPSSEDKTVSEVYESLYHTKRAKAKSLPWWRRLFA